MTVLILLIICGVGILIYSFFKEHIYLHELKRREDNYCKILLVSSGRKMHAFTIENSKYVSSSVAYSVGGLYKFILRLSGVFLNNVQVNRYIKNVAIKEAVVRMKEQSNTADYIVDVKFEVVSLGVGEVLAHAYGTALFLYKDTLGLFNYPEELKFKLFTKVKSLILTRLVILITLTSIILSSLFYGYFRLADVALDQFKIQNEKTLWSFIKSSTLEHRDEAHELANAEEQLQLLLEQIIQVSEVKLRNYKIYLLKDDIPNINIYPSGNITISLATIKGIKSENALAFLLAHEIAHLINNDLLAHQRTGIINEYLATVLLNEESAIGKLFVSRADFEQLRFAEPEEEKADQFAAITLQLLYGHVGGIEEAMSYFYNLSPVYQQRHPLNQQRLSALNTFIGSNKFTIKDVKPLDIIGSDEKIAAHPTPNIPTYEAMNSSVLVNNFLNQSGLLFNEYHNFLLGFANILVLQKNITKKELDNRLSQVDNGANKVREFQKRFYDLVSDYNLKISTEAYNELEVEKAKSFLIEWDKAKANQLKIAVNTFDRDYNILLAQQRLLHFLTRRYGTFKIVQNQIIFDSINASEQYTTLYQQLQRSYVVDSANKTSNKH